MASQNRSEDNREGRTVSRLLATRSSAAETLYSPAVCDEILQWAEQGMFPEEWAHELGVSLRTLYRWANRHPDFEETVRRAWLALSAYYGRWFRTAAGKPNTKPGMAVMLMTRRFPDIWAETREGVTLPSFEARDRTDLEPEPGETIDGTLSAPVAPPTTEQIAQMDEAELLRQIDIMEARLRARRPKQE